MRMLNILNPRANIINEKQNGITLVLALQQCNDIYFKKCNG